MIKTIINQIRAAETKYNRQPHSVKLLAVSKKQTIDAIKQAIAQGQRCFAENYVQEALPKIAALQQYNLEWHFIGPIQSNKTKAIAENFAWVHSIDRLKIAQRLSAQRPAHLPPLNICIEINVSNETSKSGVSFTELPTLAAAIKQLPKLKLRGLMAIPAPGEACISFQKLVQAIKQFPYMDTLSMGMSDDFEEAIAAGATMVRIGTAIFGER